MSSGVDQERLAREAEHYDRVVAGAGALPPEVLAVAPDDLHDRSMDWLPFLGVPRLVERVLSIVRPAPGRRILDFGCGAGFLSIALAHRGASVEAIDISEASIALARARAEASGVADRIRFQVGDAHVLPVEDGALDAACGLFVLHHLDLDMAGRELARVLKPDAPAAFVETMGLNPLLMAARSALPGHYGIEKASTDDERPLDRRALERLSAALGADCRVDCPELVFARLATYLPPLQNRAGMAMLGAFDGALGRIKPLRRWSYFAIVAFEAPARPATVEEAER
jgi:SAM-dependent methyltransferase